MTKNSNNFSSNNVPANKEDLLDLVINAKSMTFKELAAQMMLNFFPNNLTRSELVAIIESVPLHTEAAAIQLIKKGDLRETQIEVIKEKVPGLIK